ncbi:MAG: hypothetical protein AAFQ12_14280 [Pseudomonadota bacterium]
MTKSATSHTFQRMKRFIILAVLIAQPAWANAEREANKFAKDLASILAAESYCGLSYDPEAISALIAERVDPSVVSFAGNLDSHIWRESLNEDPSAGMKIARCAAVEQTARHFGFIE